MGKHVDGVKTSVSLGRYKSRIADGAKLLRWVLGESHSFSTQNTAIVLDCFAEGAR
jgi:hypothetical protein